MTYNSKHDFSEAYYWGRAWNDAIKRGNLTYIDEIWTRCEHYTRLSVDDLELASEYGQDDVIRHLLKHAPEPVGYWMAALDKEGMQQPLVYLVQAADITRGQAVELLQSGQWDTNPAVLHELQVHAQSEVFDREEEQALDAALVRPPQRVVDGHDEPMSDDHDLKQKNFRKYFFWWKKKYIFFGGRRKYFFWWKKKYIFFVEEEIYFFLVEEEIYFFLVKKKYIFFGGRRNIFFLVEEEIYFFLVEEEIFFFGGRRNIFFWWKKKYFFLVEEEN